VVKKVVMTLALANINESCLLNFIEFSIKRDYHSVKTWPNNKSRQLLNQQKYVRNIYTDVKKSPNGPMREWTYGNGERRSYVYDKQYRLKY
jgi:hypothetical protein